MKKRILVFLLAAMILVGCCGCSAAKETPAADNNAPAPAEAAPETPTEADGSGVVTVTDMVGREVDIIPGSYQRVVCIGAGALRMYSYVGDVTLLCGVEDIDNTTLEERPKMFDSTARPYLLAYGDVFAALPSCGVGGPTAQTAEAEKILSCAPDIVISQYEDVEKEDALQEQLGVPVITLRTGSNGVFADEFKASIELLGKVFQKEERAQQLNDFVAAETAEISTRTAGIADGDKPLVYICGLGNWGTTDHLMTSQSYKPFEVAHINNVVTDLSKDGVQPIEEEKFVALGEDMDIVIIDAAAVKNIKKLMADDPTIFDSSKAWQNGEVYLQMAYNAYYTNHEIALINTWYNAKIAYPEVFEDVDMTEVTDRITEMFLGKALAEEIFACPSSFGGYQKIDTVTFFS